MAVTHYFEALYYNNNLFSLQILSHIDIIFSLITEINISNMIFVRTKGPKTPPAPELSEFKKEVIFCSMLGDLTAERELKNGNTRLRFYMALKNKELIFHLYSLFKPYEKTEPRILNRKLNNWQFSNRYCFFYFKIFLI